MLVYKRFLNGTQVITSGNSTTTAGSSTAWPGNSNFPTVTAAYQAGGAVRIGTSSAVGSITSKTLDLSVNGGNFSVSFDVKGWTTVEGDIIVTVTGLTPQTVTYTAVMAGSFENKVLNFTGGTANSTVKIATSAKRAYIDNIKIYFIPAADPIFTPAAGTYTSTQSVTIANGSSTDKIYYTTDGTDPSTASTLYTGAIEVAVTTTIKAIAYDQNNANPSNIVSATYTMTSTGVKDVNNNLTVSASHGMIKFSAAVGEKVEIFSAAGQKIISKVAAEGINEVPVSVKGVLVVKVGNKTGKIIL